jgi:tetratricopeptide (TPR) repeat protein
MSSFTKRTFPFLLSVIFLLAPVLIAAQSRIQGQVFGSDRRPLADVYVELLNDTETVIQRIKTNGAGLYLFTVASSGRYYVRVRTFGTNYEEQTAAVEINNFVGGRQVTDSQQQDFFLKERKNNSSQDGSASVLFFQEVPTRAKEHYERGLVHLNGQRVDLALEELRNAISVFPIYFDALNLLGTELVKQQKFEEATAILERAIAVNERSGAVWYGLAFCYYASGQTAKAVEAARKCVTFGPETVENQLILGIALRRAQKFVDAEKALLRAKKISEGKSPDVLWNLALLYAHNLKKLSLAADELEAYLKLRPDHPDAPLLKKLIQRYRTEG